MREIKFRVWDNRGKKMLNVAGAEFISGGEIISAGTLLPDEVVYGKNNGGYFSPMMQFTGLHDKNGREIYEGDVVRYTAWHDGKPMGAIQGEVVYDGDLGMASFNIRLDHDGEVDRSVLPARGVEIMGNVFENPELLEAEK